MTVARRLIAKRRLAVLLVAVTLLLRLLVPAGYMIASDHGRLTITVCSGVAAPAMAMDMPGMREDGAGHGKGDHGRAEMPCAFSGLTAATLSAIDPILLATFVAFVIATGLTDWTAPTRRRQTYLRPPLRGPPRFL